MENQQQETLPSRDVKLIHVKIIGGGPADIVEVRKVMKELKKKLPYDLEVIISNDVIELQSVDAMIKELEKIKTNKKGEE